MLFQYVTSILTRVKLKLLLSSSVLLVEKNTEGFQCRKTLRQPMQLWGFVSGWEAPPGDLLHIPHQQMAHFPSPGRCWALWFLVCLLFLGQLCACEWFFFLFSSVFPRGKHSPFRSRCVNLRAQEWAQICAHKGSVLSLHPNGAHSVRANDEIMCETRTWPRGFHRPDVSQTHKVTKPALLQTREWIFIVPVAPFPKRNVAKGWSKNVFLCMVRCNTKLQWDAEAKSPSVPHTWVHALLFSHSRHTSPSEIHRLSAVQCFQYMLFIHLEMSLQSYLSVMILIAVKAPPLPLLPLPVFLSYKLFPAMMVSSGERE